MPPVDTVLTPAVEVARAAAVEAAGDPALVGPHLGAVTEGERVVSHQFASEARGYRGWHWTVTLARVPRGRKPTVSEVHLLPGEDAVRAPQWVPWADRLRPGDLGPGDVLPRVVDDARLDQGYEATGDEDADRLAIHELGLGRPRVLSREGRAQAAERWYAGSHGPTAAQAIASDAPCSTCGFLVLLAGSLRTQFGVCANEWSPDDGKVVSLDHGCGAHSETDVAPSRVDWPAPRSPYEGLEIEPREAGGAAPPEGSADTPAEEAAPTDGGAAPDEASPSGEAPAPGEATATDDGPAPGEGGAPA